MIKEKYHKMLERFNNDLAELCKMTGEEVPTLYENAYTTFGISNIRLEGNFLKYDYHWGFIRKQDVTHERERFDEEDFKETLKFWRAAIRRAKIHFSKNSLF